VVLDYGVPGERTDEVRPYSQLAATHPSVVLIMEGTNDILQGRQVSALRANLRAMVPAVRQRGAPRSC
jgi:lysophospholipase L1-like esterase